MDITAFNFLTLSQSVSCNIKGLNLSQHIFFTEMLDSNLLVQQCSSFLDMADLATVTKTVAFEIEQELVLTQGTQPRQYNLEASNFLFIWGEALNYYNQKSSNTLIINQDVVVEKAIGIYQSLVLTQTVLVNKTVLLPVNQTLTLYSRATAYKDSPYFSSVPTPVQC